MGTNEYQPFGHAAIVATAWVVKVKHEDTGDWVDGITYDGAGTLQGDVTDRALQDFPDQPFQVVLRVTTDEYVMTMGPPA